MLKNFAGRLRLGMVMALAGLLIAGLSVFTLPEAVEAQTAEVINIEIKDFKFTPDKVTAKVGTKIVWTNLDTASHTVTSNPAGTMASGLIRQNAKFEFTVTKAGVINYFCEPHPFMTASITGIEGAAQILPVSPVATTAVAQVPTTAAPVATTARPATTAATATTAAATAVAISAPAAGIGGSANSTTGDNGILPYLIAGLALLLIALVSGFFLSRARTKKER